MNTKKYNGDDLYRIDQAIQTFCKEHSARLSDKEREELGEMLNERAKAMSDVLGIEIHSIFEKSEDEY